jgi:predicted anti-sigma-YlaC factor YlaD
VYRCSEVVRLISSDEYLAAGLFKRLQIRLHLAMCENCSKYARQLRALAAALRKAQEPAASSEIEATKGRILRRLSQK